MRRLLISLAVMLPLVGAAAAAADGFGGGSGPGTPANEAMVVGTIVSVNATTGTFVADAWVVPQFDGGHGFGHLGGFGGFGFPGSGATGATGFGGDYRMHDGVTGATGATGATGSEGPTEPTPTQVTITVGPNTKLEVKGVSSPTVGSLAPGDRFSAAFTGSPGDSITTLTANPSLSIDAAPAPQRPSLYAFAGTVTGTTASSVTVRLFATYPSSLGAAGSAATFTVGSSTLVLGGTNGFTRGDVSNVAKGDIVAGGLVGSPGETAAQVEAQPLMLLLDLPVGSITGTTGATGTSGASGSANASFLKREKAAELKRAEQLLGLKVKSSKQSSKKHTSHKTHH
jgi:hypothetical protein